jgi:two-component system, chemotaxis family, chemotaxis protein CheY
MPKSCLVVDDSHIVRAVARRMLENLDFAVEEAENGRLALDACMKRMPDAVLLDWNMPVMSGIEFLRHLRGAPGGTSPVVVFCTTHCDVEHIDQALGAGAAEYIIKPFDGEILQGKLAQLGLI